MFIKGVAGFALRPVTAHPAAARVAGEIAPRQAPDVAYRSPAVIQIDDAAAGRAAEGSYIARRPVLALRFVDAI
jgi:hypothetical protein